MEWMDRLFSLKNLVCFGLIMMSLDCVVNAMQAETWWFRILSILAAGGWGYITNRVWTKGIQP